MELTEFKEKYPFIVKEIKNDKIILINFEKFIKSDEWNNFSDKERFVLLTEILNCFDCFDEGFIELIDNGQKYARYNYGDYEQLIKDYLPREPINITEFSEEYNFIVEKIEDEIIFLKEYENVISSSEWLNLSFNNQNELLKITQNKLIDKSKGESYEKLKKLIEKRRNYTFPAVIINCNEISDKWTSLFKEYESFNYLMNGYKTKEEIITYLSHLLYENLIKDEPESKMFINEIERRLLKYGANEKIDSIEKRVEKYKERNQTRDNINFSKLNVDITILKEITKTESEKDMIFCFDYTDRAKRFIINDIESNNSGANKEQLLSFIKNRIENLNKIYLENKLYEIKLDNKKRLKIKFSARIIDVFEMAFVIYRELYRVISAKYNNEDFSDFISNNYLECAGCMICTEMENYTQQNLKLNELPEKCRLKDRVINSINDNISNSYEIKKEINSAESMKQYCNKKITEYNDLLQKVIKIQKDKTILRNDKWQFERNFNFLYSKGTIKFYTKKLNELQSSSEENNNSITMQKQQNNNLKSTIEIENEELNNNSNITQEIEDNDLILSTIEDYLFDFKEDKILDEKNYNKLVSALDYYFKEGKFNTNEIIEVRKVNKKKFGWALNMIFRQNNSNNEALPIEYLRFAKKNISIFQDDDLDETNYLKCNLYKYFTTKT